MTTVFNSNQLEPATRLDAWLALIGETDFPASLCVDAPEGGADDSSTVSGWVDAWSFGRVACTRSSMNRRQTFKGTDKQARGRLSPSFMFTFQEQGAVRHSQFGNETIVQGGLLITDLTSAFETGCTPSLVCVALHISTDDLGLPFDTVRTASQRLEASPMYELVRRHVIDVSRQADELSAGPGSVAVGTATVELLRGLISTAAEDQSARDVLAESMLSRVRSYVRQNLSEPNLHVERIAAEHHISERYLYRICNEAGFSLTQWIMSLRLSQASAELSSTEHSRRSVGTIAARAGFVDPSHFSRRFKEEFGVSPLEWRRNGTRDAEGR